ncbi:MAG: universal stress protein [Chthoniobacterales bacterium]
MKTLWIRNLLVPIDFSPMSIESIAKAKEVAQQSGAAIHLVHVHHQQYPVTFMGPVLSSGRPAISFEEYRVTALGEDLRDVARRNNLSADSVHLCEGASVYHEICRLAQGIRADLIVMPTHGRTGLRHTFLGSTAERVVRHSPCPVLVTRVGKEKKAKAAPGKIAPARARTILVPIDFSEASSAGLNYAIEFAERAGAKLIILHSVYVGDELSTDGLGVYRFSDVRQVAREEAERQLEAFLRPVQFGRVQFETLLKTGHPVAEICAVAEQHRVDLIITATHGRTGFAHLLIGSVAEQVVRRASQSVLVVPSHPETRVKELKQVVRQGNRRRDSGAKRSIAAPQLTSSARTLTI